MPELAIRAVTPDDVAACARVAHDAHATLARAMAITPAHSSEAFFRFAIGSRLAAPCSRGFLATRGDVVVGSVFATEFPAAGVASIGPLTVAPEHEGQVGRALLTTAMRSCEGARDLRLTQSPVMARSLALYIKCGFHLVAPLAVMSPPTLAPRGAVRAMTAADLAACHALCAQRYGFVREREIARGIERATGRVVERAHRIVGYATGLHVGGHAIADTDEDLLALLSGDRAVEAPGILVPLHNTTVVQALLAAGSKIEWFASSMSTAPRPITGPYCPSLTL